VDGVVGIGGVGISKVDASTLPDELSQRASTHGSKGPQRPRHRRTALDRVGG